VTNVSDVREPRTAPRGAVPPESSSREPSEADVTTDRAIRKASIAAAGLAVVLSPIPFADEIALLPIYGWLTVRVARARGRGARYVPWRALTRTALAGLAVRAAVNAPTATLPGVAAAMNAVTAVGLTATYGACVDYVCRAPSELTAIGPRDVLAALRTRMRRRVTRGGSRPG
jgi:uncharacterized protein (DUF697 family)